MDKLGYTVFIDGELWVNVVDDVYSNRSWAAGGIVFTNGIKSVYEFINNLREYSDWKNSKFEIKEIYG